MGRRLLLTVLALCLVTLGCSSSTDPGRDAAEPEGPAGARPTPSPYPPPASDACVDAVSQSLTDVYLPVLTECADVDEYFAGLESVDPTVDADDAVDRLRLFCERTDAGSEGAPRSHSTVCAEAYG